MYYNIRMKHARPGHNVAFIQAFSQKKALRKHSRGKPGKFFKDGGALYFQPESKTGNPAPLYYAV
ncbi:MAG: hypothetical protein GXY05_15905, partial [Clostridiales bacterium]|nr:hypothetical protein [Clostridiales bacterium]